MIKKILSYFLVRSLGYIQNQDFVDPHNLLADILQHAFEDVSYYRELPLRHRVVEDGKIKLEHFTDIPFLDKSIIRTQSQALIAEHINHKSTYWNTSGGSTGEPIRFLQDKNYLRAARGVTYAQKAMTGYRFGEPMIKLWGDEREIIQGTRSFRSRFANYLKGITFLNSFSMSPEDMRHYIQAINTIRPKLIVAYAQSMYELCKFAEKEGLSLAGIGAVMTSAGTLYPFMREIIERVCHAKVFNRYGSREVGNIACECEQQKGLHIAANTVHVEVVDEAGNPCLPSVEGEIVVTSLINRAMPLIRYRIGDRGIMSLEPCSCGRPGRMLKQVTGRTVDVFKTENGRRVDGEYFTHLIYFRDWVEKFQFVQKTFNLIEVRIVANASAPKKDVQDIKDKIQLVMGVGCDVSFVFVDQIPPSKSGKYRYTISEVE